MTGLASARNCRLLAIGVAVGALLRLIDGDVQGAITQIFLAALYLHVSSIYRELAKMRATEPPFRCALSRPRTPEPSQN